MEIPEIRPMPFKNAPYSRAMFDDEWIFVSGTIGMDYHTSQIPETVHGQVTQMLRNISEYLERCGGTLANIVNYTLIIAGHEHAPQVVEALAEQLPCKPTGTAMIAGIALPGALVEMQVIARRSHHG